MKKKVRGRRAGKDEGNAVKISFNSACNFNCSCKDLLLSWRGFTKVYIEAEVPLVCYGMKYH